MEHQPEACLLDGCGHCIQVLALTWSDCSCFAGQAMLDGITASFINAFFVRSCHLGCLCILTSATNVILHLLWDPSACSSLRYGLS